MIHPSHSVQKTSGAPGSAALRLIVIPRWAGTPASDFYPWLRDRLAHEQPQPFESVAVLDMPQPQVPTVRAWVDAVLQAIGDDRTDRERTVLMGHSVGCQAVLRALAELPEGAVVRAVLGVAGWFTVDEPWPTLLPWIQSPFDAERARRAAGRICVLLGDNDPFTADAAGTARVFGERLGAECEIIPGGRHFNRTEEPEVLRARLKLAAAI